MFLSFVHSVQICIEIITQILRNNILTNVHRGGIIDIKKRTERLMVMFHKITKQKAKQLVVGGEAVYACPSKMNPHSVWASPFLIMQDVDDDTPIAEWFEKWCNAYRYYNCNAETGKGIKFYIKTA